MSKSYCVWSLKYTLTLYVISPDTLNPHPPTLSLSRLHIDTDSVFTLGANGQQLCV